MTKVTNFFARNEGVFSFIRWCIIPVILAASFWVLDGRYLSKSDWQTAQQQQNAAVVQLGLEQKNSFNKLTDAITALTIEQRNVAEYQRANGVSIDTMMRHLDKNETADNIREEKQVRVNDKIDSRLSSLEVSVAREEALHRKN